MSKTLRITFSGICTRAPGYPRNGEKEPDTLYVLMPAARNSRKQEDKVGPISIGRHHAFVYVPAANLDSPLKPAFTVDDEVYGLCNVYLIDHTRLTFDRPPLNEISHFLTELPLGERPGPEDIAPEGDVRWLLDMRDIAPDHHKLKLTADPRRREVDVSVSTVVEIPGGTIRANFPCKTVQPQEFRPPTLKPMEPPVRVIASEFIVEMEYPDETTSVTLNATPLRSNSAASGLGKGEVVLTWGPRRTIDIRIGNDTLQEIQALQSIKRCNARPIVTPRDNDFALHFDLFDFPPGVPRPLPFRASHQTQHNGCAGLSGTPNP